MAVMNLRHPYCNGDHPTRMPREGPYTYDQCKLCWMVLNEPEKVLALIENRPYAEQAATPVKPVRTRWPWWALTLWLASSNQDRGVGDTAARLIGYVGGKWLVGCWKRWSKKDCGCQGRQGRWNRLYPYNLNPAWRLFPFAALAAKLGLRVKS